MGLCRKCERSPVAVELHDQYAFGVPGQLQVAVGSQIVVSKCLHNVLLCVINLSDHLVSALLDDRTRSFPRQPISVECRSVSRKRLCSPMIRQNCLGLESPAILRVSSRNRTPSPPARSTAQRCTADESACRLGLASRPLSRSA